MWPHIQRKHHECRRHNVVRLMDSIRFVNGLKRANNLSGCSLACFITGAALSGFFWGAQCRKSFGHKAHPLRLKAGI